MYNISLSKSAFETPTGKYISLIFGCGALGCGQFLIQMVLKFLCARTRSLYLYSSTMLVLLFGGLFLLTSSLKTLLGSLEKSYFLQSYKTDIFSNAYIFSAKLALAISFGLNVSMLIHLMGTKLLMLIHSDSLKLVNVLVSTSFYLAGRIKGHMKTRFVPKLTLFPKLLLFDRILDLGYISSGSKIGLFGLLVGTFL